MNLVHYKLTAARVMNAISGKRKTVMNTSPNTWKLYNLQTGSSVLCKKMKLQFSV
jgi:hypothetical protein